MHVEKLPCQMEGRHTGEKMWNVIHKQLWFSLVTRRHLTSSACSYIIYSLKWKTNSRGLLFKVIKCQICARSKCDSPVKAFKVSHLTEWSCLWQKSSLIKRQPRSWRNVKSMQFPKLYPAVFSDMGKMGHTKVNIIVTYSRFSFWIGNWLTLPKCADHIPMPCSLSLIQYQLT